MRAATRSPSPAPSTALHDHARRRAAYPRACASWVLEERNLANREGVRAAIASIAGVKASIDEESSFDVSRDGQYRAYVVSSRALVDSRLVDAVRAAVAPFGADAAFENTTILGTRITVTLPVVHTAFLAWMGRCTGVFAFAKFVFGVLACALAAHVFVTAI